MYRRPIVVGNWKMQTQVADAILLARRISHAAEQLDDVDIVLLPPVIWLPSILEDLHHRPRSLQFGVQNFYPKDSGAYTGEIGLKMIEKLVHFVLIGHSERRTIFQESDGLINEKVQAALGAKLRPIVCVGELTKVMLRQRDRGRPTLAEKQSNVLRQLRSALQGLHERDIEHLVVCYEPLWAIGMGENVPGSHVQAILEQFRQLIVVQFGRQAAQRVRMLYGGSVTPNDIASYVRQPDIDGVLVGGASLKADSFLQIVEAVMQHTEAAHVSGGLRIENV